MRRKYRITFAASAVKDLETIRSWYADQQIPEVGERLVQEVVSTVERLADFPESGRIVPEFGIPNLREIIYPPFRIVHRVDKMLYGLFGFGAANEPSRCPNRGIRGHKTF